MNITAQISTIDVLGRVLVVSLSPCGQGVRISSGNILDICPGFPCSAGGETHASTRAKLNSFFLHIPEADRDPLLVRIRAIAVLISPNSVDVKCPFYSNVHGI